MTVFIWTPRIGHLAAEKNQKMVRHYTNQLKILKDTYFEAPQVPGVPYIHGAFSNWKPKPMRDVVEFCKKHDQNKPDFVQECIVEGLVRP